MNSDKTQITDLDQVWIATVEQEIGDPIPIVADSKDVAKAQVEELVAQWDKVVKEWLPSPHDDSEMGHISEGKLNAIVRRNPVHSEK